MGARGPKTDKIWSDAVRRAVLRNLKGTKKTHLEELADTLVAKGLEGDTTALKEIADRLDGKPHATSDNKTTLGLDDPLMALIKDIQAGKR